MTNTKNYRIGDFVEWKSGGTGGVKKGIVVDIINPGEMPDRKRFRIPPAIGCARQDESYVVLVNTRTFWPVSIVLSENLSAGEWRDVMADELADRDAEIARLKATLAEFDAKAQQQESAQVVEDEQDDVNLRFAERLAAAECVLFDDTDSPDGSRKIGWFAHYGKDGKDVLHFCSAEE